MKWYSIGEFAAKTGVTPDFIKYYEKNGLRYTYQKVRVLIE